MATPEGKVKGWLDKMFKAEGVCYFAPQSGPYGDSGVEDRIAIVCGLYVGVEAKANAKAKMTAKQELRREKVLEAGGAHFLVYDKATIEEVRKFILDVRARHSRQEGGSCILNATGGYSSCDTHSATCTELSSANSSPPGRNPGSTELRV